MKADIHSEAPMMAAMQAFFGADMPGVPDNYKAASVYVPPGESRPYAFSACSYEQPNTFEFGEWAESKGYAFVMRPHPQGGYRWLAYDPARAPENFSQTVFE
jgi:hypothetical protein